MSSFFHSSYVSLSLSHFSLFCVQVSRDSPFSARWKTPGTGLPTKVPAITTNLQMKNIKGAAPIVSLSCPGKIGSLRPKNDIVYINRGPWLDATMFVMSCCPPSLLLLPTGHFSSPSHNRSFEGFLCADKERKNGTTKKESKGEKDKHGHNCKRIQKDMIGPFSVSLFQHQFSLFRTN